MGESMDSEMIVQARWLEWGGALGPAWGAALLVFVVAVGAAVLWRFSPALSLRRRALLVGLRVSLLAVLVALLLRPVLVQSVSVKSNAVVAVLYDDSESMTIGEGESRSRADRMVAALEEDTRAFDQALQARYHQEDFRFGATVRPLKTREALRFEDKVSAPVDAVLATARDFPADQLAAVVVISDGVRSADDTPDWSALRDLGIPVYTVGVGEAGWRDLALNEVSLSRSFLDEAPIVVGAQVDATGLAEEAIVVEALRGGTVVASETRTVPDGEASLQFRLEVPLEQRDWYALDIRVRTESGTDRNPEFVAENNQHRLLYDHREKSYRVLYFAGRPNWQHKFMIRALEADPEVQLASLVRISGAEKSFVFRGRDSSLGNPLFDGFENERDLPRYDEAVFMRLGLAPEELAEGYPTKAEELYPYHLIIWGSIEPDFFATPQLLLTRDAVSDRGAAFLLLGGPGNNADDLADTVLAPLVPTLPRYHDGSTDDWPGEIAPTPEAFLTGVWALHGDHMTHDRLWEELPPLPDVQPTGPARIGATVLARAEGHGEGVGDNAPPFFLWQRYGLGRGALIATGETWPWHLQTAASSGAHERLWRQTVRALVRDVPEQISMTHDGSKALVGVDTETVWTVRNNEFQPLVGARLEVSFTDPTGETETVPLLEVLTSPGRYRASMTPIHEGLHRARLVGETREGEPVPETETAFMVDVDRREWRRPRFDPTHLQQMAAETGGRYFPLDALQDLPAALDANDARQQKQERTPLWNMPWFYGVLLLVMLGEWTLRRRAGQP